jgi:hypothetical protein
MAPQGRRNHMEDHFWRIIDQWGADGLALLRSKDPAASLRLNRERLAIFIMSFVFRNPRAIAAFEKAAKEHVTSGCLKSNYKAYRRPHEPETFEEFLVELEEPGLSEFGAHLLKSQVLHKKIRAQLLTMNWQVATMSRSLPILTSDAPLITYKGLKQEDGMWILPLSPNEFFVAFNPGNRDMMREIAVNVQSGVFIESMNKYVVQHRIEYVYGSDASQLDFVRRHWSDLVTEEPWATG